MVAQIYFFILGGGGAPSLSRLVITPSKIFIPLRAVVRVLVSKNMRQKKSCIDVSSTVLCHKKVGRGMV